jgi:FtsZ-binding cell division protein ZapB
LTRPSIPDSISKVDGEEQKLKQAIEAIAYMSRSVSKKEKEMGDIQREKAELQYTLDAVKRERDYLKKNVELMAKTDLERKRKREATS